MNTKAKVALLQTLGIDVYQQRGGNSIYNFAASETAIETGSDSAVSKMNFDELRKCIADCQLCELHQTRTQTVFGIGNPNADLVLIGEAPGANEDLQGEPFVGRAGKLLDAMLQAIGLNRQQIFIANILKCRPPNNRDPKPEEVATCTPYLERQLALIQPKLIVALGRIATHFLLKTDVPMSRLRGKRYQFGAEKIPMIATYHPAYLLRSPREKAKALEDLLEIQALLKR